jgi:hypothetical protein
MGYGEVSRGWPYERSSGGIFVAEWLAAWSRASASGCADLALAENRVGRLGTIHLEESVAS